MADDTPQQDSSPAPDAAPSDAQQQGGPEPQGDSGDLAAKALEALKGDDPVAAARALQAALKQDPERLDLLHALAVTELQLGEAASALAVTQQAERVARQRADAQAGTMMPQILLARAAALEDLFNPAGAASTFREILKHEPQNPRARQSLGHLLLGWSRVDEGIAELEGYLEDGVDQDDFLDATRAFLEHLRAFLRDDIHPKELLNAHRGSYVEFFDHHASRLEDQGWIAEAARMHKDDDGNVVLSVPEGAPEWAGVRVDLVNPETGQPGRVGDQPMVVALANYETLAQAPVLIRWPQRDLPFAAWVSTQVPWNHFRVQISFDQPVEEPHKLVEPVIGDWYRAGFEGDFGTQDRGRFHEVDDIAALGKRSALVHLDLGRSEVTAIPDLFKRLDVLHSRQPLAHVVLGRGYLPED